MVHFGSLCTKFETISASQTRTNSAKRGKRGGIQYFFIFKVLSDPCSL